MNILKLLILLITASFLSSCLSTKEVHRFEYKTQKQRWVDSGLRCDSSSLTMINIYDYVVEVDLHLVHELSKTPIQTTTYRIAPNSKKTVIIVAGWYKYNDFGVAAPMKPCFRNGNLYVEPKKENIQTRLNSPSKNF